MTHISTTEDDERRGTSDSHWLPDDARSEAPAERSGDPSRAARQWAVHSAWNPPRQVETTHRVIGGDLRAFSRTVEALEAKVDTLRAKVDALERAIAVGRDAEQVRAASARDAAGPEQTDDDAVPGSAPPRRAATEVDHGNINTLSFEQLRDLGLSVNQAARLISERDRRGGFRSLDELDELHGFPEQLLTALKRGVTI